MASEPFKSVLTHSMESQPSRFAASSVPLPARTMLFMSMTIGFCCPKRRSEAMMESMFRSSCFRALAGSLLRSATLILKICILPPLPPCEQNSEQTNFLLKYWANGLRIKTPNRRKYLKTRGAYHVCFSCHSAFLPLLTRVISTPEALTISTDHSYHPGRSVPVTVLATSKSR